MNRITFTTAKGDEYIAEFNLDTVSSMEERHITPVETASAPATKIKTFFFWAFKMHHPKIKQDTTNDIWANLPSEGKEQVIAKLGEFWYEAQNAVMEEPEDDSKKVMWEIG